MTYTKVPLELIINGSYPNALNYLLDLESLYYYINVKSTYLTATMSKVNDASDIVPSKETEDSTKFAVPSTITMHIAADTYWKD